MIKPAQSQENNLIINCTLEGKVSLSHSVLTSKVRFIFSKAYCKQVPPSNPVNPGKCELPRVQQDAAQRPGTGHRLGSDTVSRRVWRVAKLKLNHQICCGAEDFKKPRAASSSPYWCNLTLACKRINVCVKLLQCAKQEAKCKGRARDSTYPSPSLGRRIHAEI